MSPQIRYTGNIDEVEVPSAGVTCKRGGTVDVSPEVAKSLLRQDTWSAVKPVKKKAVAAKAVPKMEPAKSATNVKGN